MLPEYATGDAQGAQRPSASLLQGPPRGQARALFALYYIITRLRRVTISYFSSFGVKEKGCGDSLIERIR